MKHKILILIISSFLLRISHCANTDKDLCAALQVDEETFKTLLNESLRKVDMDKDQEQQFNQIKVLLLKQSCIEKAEFAKGFLRTSPPIKQLFLTTSSDMKIKDITINFSVTEKDLSIEKIIINKSL